MTTIQKISRLDWLHDEIATLEQLLARMAQPGPEQSLMDRSKFIARTKKQT